ncbi:MAG: eL32 family ribosomal protein [Candidatus Micrarchaeota archaeon]
MASKKSKPYFNIPNYRGKHGKRRVKARWRSPKGIDNKKRIRKASYGALPRVGYGNPPALRHLHPCGLPEALVHNLGELEAAKGKIARLSSTLGRRKRLLLQQKAKELGISLLGRVVK